MYLNFFREVVKNFFAFAFEFYKNFEMNLNFFIACD